jgi:hypothetical protein
MDTSLVQGMLSDSYVSTSGLVRAVRAIHLAARWNALHTMREHGVLDVGATEWWEGGARARVSLDDDVFRELARSMLYGALWRKRWRKEMIKLARGANVCAKSVCTKVLHTNILLTTLLTMASEIYTTTRGPSAAAAPEKPHSPHEGEQGRGDKGDVSGPRRHVDFRMHATHALFSFVGASFSNACIDYGREMGIELVRTLQGQVIESWRVKWNEGNRRMHRRVSTLLDHVYDVLARPYGPPPILVLTLMFIEERDNEEYYDN